MNDDLDLRLDLEAATRETAASQARTARMLQRRSSFARQRRRNRRLRVMGVATLLVAVAGWASVRISGPSEAELRHGRELVLKLAADWTSDYVQRHGELPARLSDDLPAAADVRVEPDPGGVRLSITDDEGGESSLVVPVPGQRR